MQERKTKISVRLSSAEHTHLRKQAEIAGLKMEPFIRALIMGIEIRPRPPDNISKLLREINAIGNNINQIARKANINNAVSRDDIDEVLKLLREIYRIVKY